MSENINTTGSQMNEISEPPQRSFPWATAILGAGLAIVLGFGAWEHSNLVSTRMQLEGVQKEVGVLRQNADQNEIKLNETVQAMKAELDATKKETVATTQKVSVQARRQAEKQAVKHTELMAERINKKQEEESQKVSQKFAEMNTRADQTTSKLTDITTEVGNVKTEVASTRGDLDKTISELRRTTGDMGVMSGLIATNSKELAALKELGERDYYEFTITKSQKQQRVGDIVLALRKADVKRNRYTVDIVVDDRKVEKKDKGVNEPVQFYVASKARVPYEVVVNEVKKDTIVGYLAMPKVKVSAAAARR